MFTRLPGCAHIAAEAGLGHGLASAFQHGTVKPGRTFVAHLPVKGQVRQLVDTGDFAKPLAIMRKAAFGQVSGHGPAISVEALDNPGAAQSFEPPNVRLDMPLVVDALHGLTHGF